MDGVDLEKLLIKPMNPVQVFSLHPLTDQVQTFRAAHRPLTHHRPARRGGRSEEVDLAVWTDEVI